jgi:tetratricopeptide (TPR) repeat protein
MRATRLITAVMLIAAIGAAGCSRRESRRARSAKATAAQTKSIEPPRESAVASSSNRIIPDAQPQITVAATFAEGEAAYRARNYKEAVAIFEAYIDRKPSNGWGYYMLGLSAWKSGDFAKAEKAFDNALSIDPKHVKSLVNSSRLFIDQQRNDEAIERLTRAAELDPDSPEVHRLLAETYRTLGNTDAAVVAYLKVLDLKDSDAWSMNNLALLLIDTDHAEEAVSLLTEAVELKPDVPEFKSNLTLAIEAVKSRTGNK